jgi:XPA protein C-terminus
MTLTEEQRETIRQNRERALAIQREKKRERGDQDESSSAEDIELISPEKRLRDEVDDDDDLTTGERKNDQTPDRINPSADHQSASHRKNDRPSSSTKEDDKKDDDEPLEDFEEGASEFVTRQDAMKLYCLPTGTLDVCQYVERTNPRNSAWKPMRLYHRKEIRQRARRRFDGLAGLVQERQRREDKRLSNDMAKATQLFR